MCSQSMIEALEHTIYHAMNLKYTLLQPIIRKDWKLDIFLLDKFEKYTLEINYAANPRS